MPNYQGNIKFLRLIVLCDCEKISDFFGFNRLIFHKGGTFGPLVL
jgi:hypothetical protein